jgi:general secretion pathway protein A
MYESFFGLTVRPFDLTSDPAFLVLTAPHQEALNNLQHAIATAKPVTLLIGEAGTGKTTVISAAIDRQRGRTHCVCLQNPALTRDELIRMIAAKFGLSPDAHRSKADLLLELEALLARRMDAQEPTVLVVDEAQNLTAEALEELRLLTNIEVGQRKPLSLVLAGQPELAKRLNEAAWQHLKQRIALRCELRPLTLNECALYVAGRVSAAGGNPGRVFTRDAVALLYRYTGGIARIINVVADNALLGAYAAALPTVTSHVVVEVCKDFDLMATRILEATTTPVPIVRASNALSAAEKQVIDSVALSALPLQARHNGHGKADGTGRLQEHVTRERPATAPAPLFGALGTQK